MVIREGLVKVVLALSLALSGPALAAPKSGDVFRVERVEGTHCRSYSDYTHCYADLTVKGETGSKEMVMFLYDGPTKGAPREVRSPQSLLDKIRSYYEGRAISVRSTYTEKGCACEGIFSAEVK
jgi:hypothetical protein